MRRDRDDAALADRFETAFSSLFASGEAASVQALVDEVLAPRGRLREGFSQGTPRRVGSEARAGISAPSPR